jgi:GLPGLI family protein
MKKTFFLVFKFSSLFSQQKINITNEARYELTFREYKNQKPEYLKNTFILIFNKNESFLKNMSLYVKDSLVDLGKIKLTGDVQKDFPVFSKYIPDLPYTVYHKGTNIIFADEIPGGGEVKYEETIKFNWKIDKETKIINGVKCIKATTTKWGRNWIAFYSPKYPMPFGPYKFHGLPGLIFEVSDEKKDYTFLLYRLKKRQKENFKLHNYPKAKKVSKAQYEKIRKNSATALVKIKVEGEPNIEKEIQMDRIKNEKNYNPIELTD